MMQYPHFETSKVSLGPITSEMRLSLVLADLTALIGVLVPMLPGLVCEYTGADFDYILKLSGSVDNVTGALTYLKEHAYG